MLAPTVIIRGEHKITIDFSCLYGAEEQFVYLTMRRVREAMHWVRHESPIRPTPR